jgi:hypothetical protein
MLVQVDAETVDLGVSPRLGRAKRVLAWWEVHSKTPPSVGMDGPPARPATPSNNH